VAGGAVAGASVGRAAPALGAVAAGDADAIVVGGGLAGLFATVELVAAGKKVLLLDQEPEASLGGQAFWSSGGLFLVDSDEQRLMASRTRSTWPGRTGSAYVEFAAGGVVTGVRGAVLEPSTATQGTPRRSSTRSSRSPAPSRTRI
jgi:predicted oxidoreductase